MKTDIPIVYCVNEWYKAHEWLEYSIDSVRKHNITNHIIIFTNALNICKTRKYMNDNNLEIIDVSNLIEEYDLSITEKKSWHARPASPMMMIRMFIPFIKEMKQYDKCLYLDIDTEVVDDKFISILDVDISQVMVAGVIDQLNNWNKREALCRKCRKFLWRNFLKDKYEECYMRLQKQIYINSGVLFMNLNTMSVFGPNKKEISDLIGIAMIDDTTKCMDQDIINSTYSIKTIPSSYNTFRGSHKKHDKVYLLHHVASEKVNRYPVLKKESFE